MSGLRHWLSDPSQPVEVITAGLGRAGTQEVQMVIVRTLGKKAREVRVSIFDLSRPLPKAGDRGFFRIVEPVKQEGRKPGTVAHAAAWMDIKEYQRRTGR